MRSSYQSEVNTTWYLSPSPDNIAPILAHTTASATTPARAVFTIDLSKISFTRV